MHSVGLELTKLTYTRLEDNLIRHRGDRCLYTWLAALIVNDTFPPPLVCRHMISVFASETVSPDAEHAVTITVIIFSSLSDDRDAMPASSAYSIPHNLCTSSSFSLRPSTLPAG